MKIAYIAHPISGNVSDNLDAIRDIARHINLYEPDVVPFAPYYLDCHCLDDSVPEERERGIKNNVALLKKGFVDELRLYGPRISKGMLEEIKLAYSLGITICPMSEGTQRDFDALVFGKTEESKFNSKEIFITDKENDISDLLETMNKGTASGVRSMIDMITDNHGNHE